MITLTVSGLLLLAAEGGDGTDGCGGISVCCGAVFPLGVVTVTTTPLPGFSSSALP